MHHPQWEHNLAFMCQNKKAPDGALKFWLSGIIGG